MRAYARAIGLAFFIGWFFYEAPWTRIDCGPGQTCELYTIRTLPLEDVVVTAAAPQPAVVGASVAGSGGAASANAKPTERPEPRWAEDPRPTLQVALQQWVRRAAPNAGLETRVPLVVVASEGGASRAAAWTLSMLSTMTAGGARSCVSSTITLIASGRGASGACFSAGERRA